MTYVTFSSSAVSAYRGIYPKMEIGPENTRVLHFTGFLRGIVEGGRGSLKGAGRDTGHDIQATLCGPEGRLS
ncbi:hypothetical protein [Roseibium litorale]|uniref:Uncharacterized protein n=1 Tax=Roseibium litorale TaxID=2803841 RepID=A0ABR9CRM0_9HYPH|nr:hypothetical protein [Roseibium litorale]MBD8893294.1 hypothetical protein [Roseibium litorale]